MGKKIAFFMLFSMVTSCDNTAVFSSYRSLDRPWQENEKIQFDFEMTDTINRHHMFITIRNDEKYMFSNLFLIATLRSPNGKVIADTLEYAMVKPNGAWLGKGFTSIKESKLWYKENIKFIPSGTYYVTLEHAMRENGSLKGIKHLQGITDVGIRVETYND